MECVVVFGKSRSESETRIKGVKRRGSPRVRISYDDRWPKNGDRSQLGSGFQDQLFRLVFGLFIDIVEGSWGPMGRFEKKFLGGLRTRTPSRHGRNERHRFIGKRK